MKNAILKMLAVSLLAFGLPVIADTVVYTIKETPVTLERQGDVYVVPAGTTVKYYTYTADGTQYVCTSEVPTELSSITPVVVQVRAGEVVAPTKCYPANYFVISP